MVSSGGYYIASASGWAMSDSGLVCTSNGPVDGEWIY